MDPSPIPGTAPAWLAASLPWLFLVLVPIALAICAGVWLLVRRARALERGADRLQALDELQRSLARLVADRDDLDLRRVEHVLLEIRDGQRRLEEALLARVQRPRSPADPEPAPAGAETSLAERVTNRLLALGYERVQVITALEELEGLGADGEIVVEATREGVLCKGRVVLRRGALSDVEMQPAYNVFP